MSDENLKETTHLEPWIVSHPEVIDPDMKIITTQFNRWESAEDKALERPDIIGLSSSGELIVIELKVVKNKFVHLQALTYAALASSFTLDLLAEEHADWLNKQSGSEGNVTAEQAKEDLENFLEITGKTYESLSFALPKVVLVAPEFPGQVLTTVQWLSEVAPEISIECHTYKLFEVNSSGDNSALVVNFNQIFPVKDLEQIRLRAQSPRISVAKEQQKNRRPSAVSRILENSLIPHGSTLKFDPTGQVNQESSDRVTAWLQEDPDRQDFTWDANSPKPLRWGKYPDERWYPQGLCKEIFLQAGASIGSFAATLAWYFGDENLSAIADKAPDETD